MTSTTGLRARARRPEILGFALLSYVPFLLSSPGQVSADTKHYFYLDPGRLMERAVSLWDPHIGTGTVPHQNIGFLFPMGPYYWVMEQIGAPDWVAQRLWMGTLSLVAGLGMLWLLQMLGARRVGAIAGALVYMLTPYQLAFTARLSVLLIPWAVLPLLVGLTGRALKRGGWRDPALFALLVLPAGSSNATSLLLVGIAPVLWLVFAVIGRQATARAALGTAGRIGILATGASVWWASGLVTQSRYGIPILDVTETIETVASASNPADLVRGLGNWFFSGSDRLGRWLDQSAAYADDKLLGVATYVAPGLALAGAAALRWRHRAYFAALVVVGVVIGVGAWPYADPSPIGSLFKEAADGSAFGLALRNTPRVVPIVVLGIAGLLAAAITALAARRRLELLAAGVVCLGVIAGFAPVWQHGYLSDRADRPEDLPAYTFAATDALGDFDTPTRVLELPGSLFGAYRWGYTVDPITPGLTDRRWVTRELPPHGSGAAVDLLAALDRRVQEGTFEPSSLVPIARMLRSGTVVLRSDLEYERFDSPRPRLVWAAITEPLAPGIESVKDYGPGAANRAAASLAMFDELELASSGLEWPPELALLELTDVPAVVDTASVRRPVVVAGSGDGLVDAAAAGLLHGTELVLYSASLDDVELRAALTRDADLIVTDSNRRRARRWNSLRDETGLTERADQVALKDDEDDFRLDPVPGARDAERTVVEHRGGLVDATSYGFTGLYRPEDRPVQAFDGDIATAWRAGGGEDPRGERIALRPNRAVRTDRVTLVQPFDVPNARWITSARLRFDGSDEIVVELDDSSRTPDGQVVEFPRRTIRRLEIEILGVSPGFDSVGFAEIDVGDVRVEEIVRLPVSLLGRAGSDALDHRLVVVLSRQRSDPADVDHRDEELALVREVTIPQARAFSFIGTARVNPSAPVAVVDDALGTIGADAVGESGHLAGSIDARAALAFDGDPATAWTAPFGVQEQQWLEFSAPNEVTIDRIDLEVVTDGRHSVPTRIRLEVGNETREVDVPPLEDLAREEARQSVTIEFPPVTGTRFRLVVDGVRTVTSTGGLLDAEVVAPVSIAEVSVLDGPTVFVPAMFSGECRADLVTIDGVAVPISVTGATADARQGVTVEPCGPPLELDAGAHVLRTRPGRETGIDVDRLVLTSAEGGGASDDPVAPVGLPGSQAGATARVVTNGATATEVRIRTDGDPFWLVLGESSNAGWTATADDGTSFGAPRLVDGFANGWLIEPREAGTMVVELRWTPQRIVWVGIALSVVAVLCALAIVWTTRRRAAAVDLSVRAGLGSPAAFDGPNPSLRGAVIVALGTAVAAGVASRPWIGGLVGVATFLACRVSRARLLLVVGAPVALVVAKIAGEPELGWLAVLLLGADVVCGLVRRAGDPGPAGR